MSAYSCFNILKSDAKGLVRAQGFKLYEAQELIARLAKFTNFHDLATVAKRDPMEPRLMAAALGVLDLEEAIFKDGIFSLINYQLSELLSGPMAETNAFGFAVEDLECFGATYDEQNGALLLESTFTYQSQRDPDRGDMRVALYVRADFRLLRRQGKWIPAHDFIEILQCESELDRFWGGQPEEDSERRQTLVQALAEELKLSLQEAELLADAEIVTTETSDGLITGYWLDFKDVAIEPLRSRLLEAHGSLMIEVGANFFDHIYPDEF